MFPSHQGEINVGRYCFFIRLSGCDLKCGFCDSAYARDTGTDMKIEDIFKLARCFNRVIITGGEPLLQQKEVGLLIDKLVKDNKDITIEIETNGTIKPNFRKNFENIIFNISPKLKNSGNAYEDRIKRDVLEWYIKHDIEYKQSINFKFVVSNENDISEVEILLSDIGIPKYMVWFMPLGVDSGEQLVKLREIANYAMILGVNLSPRMHILIYGNKRGV